MLLRLPQLLLGFYVLYLSIRGTHCRLLKFTNVKCSDLPTSAGLTRYDYCRLKVVRRNSVELSLRVSLLKLPITNLTCRLQCFQRNVGYRPFLYNVHFDFCRLMAAAVNSFGFSFERFVFDAIRKHSNFNHSCPWTENYMAVDRYALDFAKVNMPVPPGVYRLDFTFYSYGRPLTLTQVFFEKIE